MNNITTAQDYYYAARANANQSLEKTKRSLLFISISRLVVLVLSMYFVVQSIRTSNNIFFYLAIFIFILFIFLVNRHLGLNRKKTYEENIFKINDEELNHLEDGKLAFYDGLAYVDPKHAYTYDLDFFGSRSLFQNLCRAYTYRGKDGLARLLMTNLPNKLIIANQKAIQEVSPKIEWRQKFTAIARTNEDTKAEYDKVIHWAATPSNKVALLAVVAGYIFPVLFFIILGISIHESSLDYFPYLSSLFLVNLVLTIIYFKYIKNEINNSSNIATTILKNAHLIKLFEEENFESEKYLFLKQSLIQEKQMASESIQKLAALFSSLDTALNPMGMILSNGSMQFHLHTYASLQKWKAKYAKHLPIWLEVVAELEVLNSLANFSYNNPEFTFPQLNEEKKLSIEALGHPLIHRSKRICNDVSFADNKFIILTGSNMSGKSTFLRSLGVNMVLGGIGCCICANTASIHAFPVLVAMRQSDSLADGESYFFAEVKRLHDTMMALNDKPHFVLLDEILRGTNSDDKRSGTIGVIEKMVQYKAIGAIATHDIEVCNIAEKYPNQLINKCFEVEIIKDELYFDYKLKEGVCKNKSATFLMKKMGVIE